MKKYLYFNFLLLLVTLSLYGQGNVSSERKINTSSFTLEDCIQYAENHNFTLQNVELNVQSSEINLRQAKENIAPSVSASASQGFNANNYQKSVGWNGNYGISAGMTLFKGLNNYNFIKQSKLQVEQSNLELEESKNRIRISIIQAFLSIMANEDLLTYQQDVIKSSQERMEQGEQQFRVGQILESDYKMLQAQYTSDLYNIENTKINIQNSYLTLKNLLAIDPNQEITIVRPDSATLFKSLEIPELHEMIDKSMNYLPELKMAQNEITSAEYDVKLQKSNFYPSLSLNAGISTGYNNSNMAENLGWGTQLWHGLGENVGLNLNIPIYQRSQVRNNVKQAQLRVQQAELSQKETEYQINQELQQYYLDVQSAHNDYLVAEAQKDAYEANFNAYSFKFKYGAVTAVDLIQQQTNYLNQLNKYMQAKYSFVLQRKILDVMMGIPVKL
ncbi:MAG: TolC family protein [Bacteroidales bacterium]|nr:TolC family protein [Bacteroidales bacterium]